MTVTSAKHKPTDSIYTIRNTKQYQQYLQSKLNDYRAYNRPITPVYKGSAYDRSHNCINTLGSTNHPLNTPISRIIHNGVLRPELELELEKYQQQLDYEQSLLQQSTTVQQYQQYCTIKQEFEKLKVKNAMLQYEAGQLPTEPDTSILHQSTNTQPKWCNVTIVSTSRPNSSIDHMTDEQKHAIVERMDRRNILQYQDKLQKQHQLQQKQYAIKQLFQQQKQRNSERDSYIEQIFSDHTTDIQHVDTVMSSNSNNSSASSTHNTRPQSRHNSRTTSRSQSAQQRPTSAHRPLSAQKQQYLNELSQPSRQHTPHDNFLHHTHSDYNGLVDLQTVHKQRRASAKSQRQQRRASQTCSVAAYQMLYTALQNEQHNAKNDTDLSPRQYFVNQPVGPINAYVDHKTNAVSTEIDQFEAENHIRLANTLHIT